MHTVTLRVDDRPIRDTYPATAGRSAPGCVVWDYQVGDHTGGDVGRFWLRDRYFWKMAYPSVCNLLVDPKEEVPELNYLNDTWVDFPLYKVIEDHEA